MHSCVLIVVAYLFFFLLSFEDGSTNRINLVSKIAGFIMIKTDDDDEKLFFVVSLATCKPNFMMIGEEVKA